MAAPRNIIEKILNRRKEKDPGRAALPEDLMSEVDTGE